MSVTHSGAAAKHLPRGFVNAAELVSGLATDIRYAGEHNFVGHRIEGYQTPTCVLSSGAAQALAQVQNDLATQRLGLKVFDCYRPKRAVAAFLRWARDEKDTTTKAEFYPDQDKRDLFRLGYVASRSAHSRGSTVDLTLVDVSSGRELDMGTEFDFFGHRSWFSSSAVTAEQRENRQHLRAAMVKHGFIPYQKEWWHFSLAREPFPATYFDFVID